MGMTKRKVLMTLCCDIFPVSAGHHKAMYEIAKHLHVQEDLSLTLLVFSQHKIRDVESYRSICDDVQWIRLPQPWSIMDILNKIAIRILPSIYRNLFWALAIRRQVMKFVNESAAVIVNYPFWYSVLPTKVRREKAIVITHDIVFYRIASFREVSTWPERLDIAYERRFELSVLRSFAKIGVFAQYEVDLLTRYGVDRHQIIKMGMPINMPKMLASNVAKCFDFITLGSNIGQNVEGAACFFERVAPLLDSSRTYSFAVAGELSNNAIWDSSAIPANFKIFKLGYVSDLSMVCAQALIGIGTVPHGSGIKVKVVEMIMNGLPMILTNSGEEGIPVLSDAVINIDRMTTDEIRSKLLCWLEDPETTMAVGRQQALSVRVAFSPINCLAKFTDAIYSLIEG